MHSWSEIRTRDDCVDNRKYIPLDHESSCFHITFKECFSFCLMTYRKILLRLTAYLQVGIYSKIPNFTFHVILFFPQRISL